MKLTTNLTGAIGGILWGLALFVFRDAYGMEITLYSGGGVGDSTNLQTMYFKNLETNLSIGLAIIGTLFACTSLILAHSGKRNEQ